MSMQENNTSSNIRRVLFVLLIFMLGVSIMEIPRVVFSAAEDEVVSQELHTISEPIVSPVVVEEEQEPKPIVLEDFPKKTVIATGYYAGVKSTGKGPGHPEYGITYSGVKVRRDHLSTIAADLNVFPLGTILYIPDYGYGIVADTGSKIIGYKIDLYFETIDDVYEQWGKRKVDVRVIQEGQGTLTEEMIRDFNEQQLTYEAFIQDKN